MGDTHLNPDNALMFGGDGDAIYLAEHDPGLLTKVTGLAAAIPSGFVDCGWISDDGINLNLDDSTGEIRGHQGNGIVKTFMDSSTTSFAATLLETKLKTFAWYTGATLSESTEQLSGKATKVAKAVMSSSRKVKVLSAIVDLHSIEGNGVRERYVIPRVELGERGEMTFQAKAIKGYSYNLTVTGEFVMYSSAPSMVTEG